MVGAVDNHRLATSPAVRVTIDVKTRAGESNRGFDDKEAALILAAARRETDPVKHWVPLLEAYSGARLSEICQLRGEDILELSGVWCIRFVAEAGRIWKSRRQRHEDHRTMGSRLGLSDERLWRR
jgi:integrase